MATIIQRFQGFNHHNCPIWVDTPLTVLGEARARSPHDIYREVKVVTSPDVTIPDLIGRIDRLLAASWGR
jgi:hypothetical protein